MSVSGDAKRKISSANSNSSKCHHMDTSVANTPAKENGTLPDPEFFWVDPSPGSKSKINSSAVPCALQEPSDHIGSAIILIFANSYEKIGQALDIMADALGQVGLILTRGKTDLLTTHNQHPADFVSPGGMVVVILERDCAHTRLGCMTSTHTDGSHGP